MPKYKYFVGIDVGTSYIKSMIINDAKEIINYFIKRTGTSLGDLSKIVFENVLLKASLTKSSIKNIMTTGFGKNNVAFANATRTEISCHAKGAYHYFPKKVTVIDIGGQDTKVIKLNDKGKIVKFKMNRKCAAGTGVFIEEIAHRLDLPLDELNNLANKSSKKIPLGSFCTVFAKTEILTRIKDGEKVEDLIRSTFESVIRRVIEMTELNGTIVVTGGVVAHNNIIVEILKRETQAEILIPPNPQLIGAFGAALFALEIYDLKKN